MTQVEYTPAEQAVLLVLKRYRDTSQHITVSNPIIAAATGLDRTTVSKVLSRLELRGLIRLELERNHIRTIHLVG